MPQHPPPLNSPADAEARRLSAAYAARAKTAPGSAADIAHRQMIAERERRTLLLLEREGMMPLAGRRLLEVGCGAGIWLRDLVRWGARPEHVFGVELLADRVAAARHNVAPGVTVLEGDIAQLQFDDASFDLVLQSTVFTSILDHDRRRRSAAEMLRVLRKNGMILWYDFHVDNPANSSVRRVGQRELAELFPGCEIHANTITLAPPIARLIAPLSRQLYDILALVPPLRTHTLAAIRPA